MTSINEMSCAHTANIWLGVAFKKKSFIVSPTNIFVMSRFRSTDDGQTRTIDCCHVVLLVCLMGLRAVPDDRNEVPTTEWAFIKWWSNGFACAIGTHTHKLSSNEQFMHRIAKSAIRYQTKTQTQTKQIISISSSFCCNASSNDLVQRNGNIQCHLRVLQKRRTTSVDCHIMFSCRWRRQWWQCGDITLN